METIYVVTEGEHSEYRIIGVFDNKEQAEKLKNINKHHDSVTRIEEYKANELASFAERGLALFYVQMKKNGDTECVSGLPIHEKETYCNLHKCMERIESKWLERATYKPTGEYTLHWQGWAKDEKHAVKITNEKRTQIIANNLWNDEGVKRYS